MNAYGVERCNLAQRRTQPRTVFKYASPVAHSVVATVHVHELTDSSPNGCLSRLCVRKRTDTNLLRNQYCSVVALRCTVDRKYGCASSNNSQTRLITSLEQRVNIQKPIASKPIALPEPANALAPKAKPHDGAHAGETFRPSDFGKPLESKWTVNFPN
jgi:hypothetical protein